MGGSLKSDVPQEQVSAEDQSVDNEQIKRLDAGYNIPVLAICGGGLGEDSRNALTGTLGENGQSMYYSPGYDYSQQASYCAHPHGPYLATGATCYTGPQYGPLYQQVSPPMMKYYSTEQDGTKPVTKKVNSQDAGHVNKPKPGVQAKLGYNVGYNTPIPSEGPNQWGVYPGPMNGGFYGSAAAYEYYTQQWHSSQRGFQPLPIPQNVGVHGNCPPMLGDGPERYQSFPRVQSASNVSGRFLKGSSIKSGSTTNSWRAKEATKSKGDGVHLEVGPEQTQTITMAKPKVAPSVQEGEPLVMIDNQPITSVDRNDYNKADFQTSYEAAKFFIIKSYSEDDIHKSIKYSVWSSTPNGNKRLDEAYRKAQESAIAPCPVFFFFSVNCSGQFCGVAEMVGQVDFNKNMDFWLQGKWNGCLPVKWHIIKDVPNGHFRHIILSNNDKKPVTHSRDTQEVHFHQGLEMLKIFKYFPTRTSLLDDFPFYDGRQRVLQERKFRQQLRQQVVRQQIKDRASEKVSIAGQAVVDADKENGRPVRQATESDIGADVILNQPKEFDSVDQVEAENGKHESEMCEVEDVAARVADLNLNRESDVKRLDGSNTPQREIYKENASSKGGDEKASKSGAGNGGSGKEMSRKTKLAETHSSLSGGNKSRRPKGSSVDAENPPTSTAKDDTSRLVINYKKALLEGMSGKAIVLDQTIGA